MMTGFINCFSGHICIQNYPGFISIFQVWQRRFHEWYLTQIISQLMRDCVGMAS